MAADFYEKSGVVREKLDCLDGACTFDLQRLCLTAPSKELRRTRNTQPAVLATGVAAYAAVTETTPVVPDVVTGHSLGQYTAITTEGGIANEDGIRLVRTRGRLMETTSSGRVGVMYAVLFADSDDISDVCEEFDTVGIAGFNTPNQTVISGEKGAVEAVQEELQKRTNARFIKVDTDEAFHSPLMNEANRQFSQVLEAVDFSEETESPIVSDITGEMYTAMSDLTSILADQIIQPINWRAVMQTLDNADVDTIVEFPPAGTLSKFFEDTYPDKNVVSIDSYDDIRSLESSIK